MTMELQEPHCVNTQIDLTSFWKQLHQSGTLPANKRPGPLQLNGIREYIYFFSTMGPQRLDAPVCISVPTLWFPPIHVLDQWACPMGCCWVCWSIVMARLTVSKGLGMQMQRFQLNFNIGIWDFINLLVAKFDLFLYWRHWMNGIGWIKLNFIKRQA